MIDQVRIDFDPSLVIIDEDRDLRDGLSAIVQVGDSLFLASDETSRIERVRRTGPRRYGEHVVFELAPLVGLAANPSKEVDVEGLAFDGSYHWVVVPTAPGAVSRNEATYSGFQPCGRSIDAD